MITRFLIALLDAELALLRWLILYGFTSGREVLPTILKIRKTRERIVHAHA